MGLGADSVRDPAEVMKQVVAKVREAVTRSVSYTCVETVERDFYRPAASTLERPCSTLLELRKHPTLDMVLRPLYSDRLRLDVTLARGGEMYSWVGASHFEDAGIYKVVKEGPIDSGAFAALLDVVFLEDVKTAVGKITVSDDEIHVETNCGGNMEILIEPYSPRPTLMVFGDTFNSPLEKTLVNVGREVGFRTIEHNPLGACGNPDLVSASVDIDSIKIPDGAYVILVTRGVNDAPLLKHISKSRINYVGMVASKNRWNASKQELEKMGVAREFIERVHAPAGLDIKSILLEEIAISILAEIIEERRKSGQEGVREVRQAISKRLI